MRLRTSRTSSPTAVAATRSRGSCSAATRSFIGDVGRPDLHVAGDALNQARILQGSLQRLLELPDHVVLYPSHYGGSVCGRGLSGNPFSSIGFERMHNPLLSIADPDAFAEAVLADAPPPPAGQDRIVARNRAGKAPTAA